MNLNKPTNNPAICVVIPYFGYWPKWMPFYWQSIKHNPIIDWLFFTDCIQHNTTFINISYPDYCELVANRLNISFKPSNPYKLCDIKPALGYIHQEYLTNYDFWGFGDVDVIYGDLRSYFTNKRLANKLLLANHARRVSGHLCFIRNNTFMNTSFKRVPKWQQYLSDTKHHAFDEGPFSRLFMFHKNWPEAVRKLAAKLHPIWSKCDFIESHSTYSTLTDGSTKMYDYWIWQNGKLQNSDFPAQKLPYLHFLQWKSIWKDLPYLCADYNLAKSSSWKISAAGFTKFPA